MIVLRAPLVYSPGERAALAIGAVVLVVVHIF